MGSWEGRGNQYIQFVRLYCKLPTNSKQLPAFPLEVGLGTKSRSQRWEARVSPLCHCGTWIIRYYIFIFFPAYFYTFADSFLFTVDQVNSKVQLFLLKKV